jgi:flagellar motor switch protein FliN/FliY
MPSEPAQIETTLIVEWTSRLASAIESMAGERLPVSSGGVSAPPPVSQLDTAQSGAIAWRQPFPPLTGDIWVVAPAGTAGALGAYVLRSVGVEDSSEAEQKSTFQEILNQALSGLAQALAARLRRDVSLSGGEESRPAAYPSATWSSVSMVLGDKTVTLQMGLTSALLDAIRDAESQPVTVAGPASPSAQRSAVDNSKTFDLLLEVELPVAVSFGRAQIPLKDVLKLTTGSIVELNRAVTDPVEIIVNNCVIARGEVVVVEGNFGVRVQEVINKQDRLRSVQ